MDFTAVSILALAPWVLGLKGPAATLAYAISLMHLSLAAVTDYPAGLVRWVPFRVHGAIELAVGIFLCAVPFLAGRHLGAAGQVFYGACGGALVVVWAMTDYRKS